MFPAIHDKSVSNQNMGNMIGTRSTIRQSKLFRQYESGNEIKSLLGQQNLIWNINQKEGAYSGPVYDHMTRRETREIRIGERGEVEVEGRRRNEKNYRRLYQTSLFDSHLA